MPIASLKDVNEAFDEGRFHSQMFLKAASTTGDLQWIDWSFSAGKPTYDARIGVSGEFNPFVATKNKAVYFPDIPEGQERHLASVDINSIAGGANQASCVFQLYDLLGVYPLIDGDDTNPQTFDNTQTLPRYEDGVGVMAVLVNHVAPMVSAVDGTMDYVDTDDNTKTVAIRIALTGLNKSVVGVASLGGAGPLVIPLTAGSKGIKRITSITFTSAPGGLFSLYLIKPLLGLSNNDGMLTANKCFTEMNCFHNHAWLAPKIYDGAWLGFFFMPNGGATTVSLFGNLVFVWG